MRILIPHSFIGKVVSGTVTLTSCTSAGNITGTNAQTVGGLVGVLGGNATLTTTSCSVTGTVSGKGGAVTANYGKHPNYVGKMVGNNLSLKYTITWKNYDGTTLTTTTVTYGAMPSYDGTPTKPATAKYTYTFNGWSPTLALATANAT